MSSNNDDAETAAALLLGPLCILAAFFAVLLTPICLLVLIFGPISLWRGCTITPEEAWGFIVRGIVGAVLVPLFAMFCAILFHFRIVDEAWPYLLLTGYTFGSVIVGIFVEKEREKAAAALPPPAPVQQLLPPQEPFRFADWKDDSK